MPPENLISFPKVIFTERQSAIHKETIIAKLRIKNFHMIYHMT